MLTVIEPMLNRPISRVRIVRVDGEYIVRAYNAAGERLPECDYYTTDKDDAVITGDMMVAAWAG